MNENQPAKAIAAQILALSAELLRLIVSDESEHAAIIEAAKKTPAKIFSISRR